MQSITACLEGWAARQPEQPLFGFIGANGEAGDGYTYRAFLERTRALAALLAARERLAKGERVLLAYPPGLELLVAFFACARLGVIPVPVAPPDALNFSAAMKTLGLIARDCGAVAVLSCVALHELVASRAGLSSRQAAEPASGADEAASKAADEAARLAWIATDAPLEHGAAVVPDDAGAILFLQYTSGSTGAPRGVVVAHRNVIHNAHTTLDHVAVGVSWLPQYHDMGLIGYGLFPVVCGGASYGMAPLDFLKRPASWLQAISRLRATYASAPNFGFEYCLRPGRIGADEMRGVDLASLRVLMNAAEPVRPETRQRFIERFAPHGLKADACVVAYGLAEHTLAATHHGRRSLTLDQAALGQQSVRLADAACAAQVRVASCGRALDGVRLRIVEPSARRVLGERRIGEIWLAGDSVCQGYWGHGEAGDVFGQRLADDAGEAADGAGGRPHAYLRTGDLGFIDDGELFVCGRSKDLIIVRGVNHYPQDIEAAVEAALPAVRPGAVAAFNGADASLVLVIEVRRRAALPEPEEIARALRRRCLVNPDIIVFAPPRAIARTTSGKVARQLTRTRWLAGQLDGLRTWRAPAAPATLRQRCAALLAQFDAAAAPHATLAELGLDSLMMTELLLDIEQSLRERGAARLVGELDATLLQRLSFARFVALLDCIEDGGAAALEALVDELRQARGEFERDIGARMRRDAELGPFDCPTRAADEAMHEVLLTGATGFFGPFLLKSLLERGDCHYHVLVRAADPDSALQRLRGALERAGLLTAELQAALAERVRVICGDLSRERLGLDGADYERLTRQVDAVVHNAAAVNYVANYEALKPHNVDATRALLEFAATARHKRFHHISSTFIFGWTARGTLPESDNNGVMAHLDFGYAQTKWVAEQLVLAARARGLDARIYRPALLSVSSGAAGDCDDVAVRLLAFMIKHGVAVDSANQLSIMAADVAADNIAAIVGQREVAGGTFHVTVDAYYNMADMTRVLSREHGYAFTYYDIPGFIAQMNLRCTRADPLYALLDFFNRSAPKIAAMQLKRYGSADYQAVRAGAAGARPDLALEQTVACLVAYLRGAGMIGPPG
jgi:thioester reductase-like protein